MKRRWNFNDITSQAGRTVIVTGANSGPGGFLEISGYPGSANIPPTARNAEQNRILWEFSERLTGVVYSYSPAIS